MSNSFYNHGAFPSTGSAATSASMRAELDLVAAGFDLMPTLSGNSNKFVVVNSTGTALTQTSTLPSATFTDTLFTIQDDGDNTRKFQFNASTVTPGATRIYSVPDANTTLVGTDTTQTLTNKTLTAPVISSIVNTGSLSLPTSTDTLVGRATTDTLTNKTLTSPVISTIVNTGTLTLPTSTDTLVGRATTDTMTNKTLTSPVIGTIVNTGTLTLPTITDTLVGRATTDPLTNKTLTSPVIGTIVNTGTLTLPTSTDTLVGRATTDTLTNKTLTSPVIGTIVNTGTLTLPTSTDTLVGRATTDTLTNKTLGAFTISGTVSGGGNQINNVIIGTSNPLAGTFTDLNTTGLVKIPSANRSAAAALTPTNPAFLYGVASTYTDTASSGPLTPIATFYSLAQPTLSTSYVTTYATAATLYLANAPVAGGSATITNAYSLYVAAGASYFGGAVTFASSVGALTVTTLTASTSITNSGLTSGRVVYTTTGGLETSSANLTFNGTTLTANTIGAFTLSGTVAGGGNQINNVIIGTTNPLAGAFTTLTSNGATTFTAGTASTTTGTGTLVITGGLGVSGRINAANFDGIVGANTAAAGSFTTLSATGNANFGNAGSSTYGGYATGGRVFSLAAAGGVIPAISASTDTFASSTAFRAYTKEVANDTSYAFDIQTGNGTGVTTQKLQLTWGANGLWNSTGLAVTGRISVSGTNPSIQQTVQNLQLDLCGGTTVGTDPAIQILGSTTTSDANKIFYNANAHVFRTSSGGSTYATIDTSGNLGIGTTTPDIFSRGYGKTVGISDSGSGGAVLQINSASGYGAVELGRGGVRKAFFTAQSTVTEFGNLEAVPLTFFTNSTERVRIDSSGNLTLGGFAGGGAGASYKTIQLQDLTSTSISSSSYGSNFTTNAYISGSTWTRGGNSYAPSKYTQFNGIHSWSYAAAAGTTILWTDAMTLDASGNLKVGTTSSANAHILETGGSGIYSTQFISSTASSPYGSNIYFSGAAPNGTSNQFLYCNDSSALRMEVRSNGGIANYSANNVNLSDRREKTNFAPAKSYLDVICAIPVQTFNYIDQNIEDDAGLTLGVVAQDVQAVAPELVMESNWASKDEEPKMRLSIYQTDLQYALMKSIQEMKAIIDSQAERIAALEAK
jgi:hypothetical protein